MNTDTRHLYVLNSTIFRAFDSDTDNFLSQIGVMGKSFGQISESINKRQIEIHDLMDTMSKIDAVNKTGGFWSYIFGNESGTKKPKDLSSFVDLDESEANTIIKSIQETQAKVNSGSRTWQDYLKTLHDRNEWQIKFIQNNDLQKASADDVIAANKDAYEAALHYNKGLKQLTFGAKASQAAFKGLAATGNMLLFMAIFKGAELAVKSLINYAHRLDDARKALADTETDLSSIETTIGETRVKVKELEALDPSSLSITDKEDLQRLKDQNEELRIRQQYLETQKQNNLKSVAAAAKEQYNLRYSEPVDKGSISRYKELYTAPKDAPPVSNYLTGNSALPDTPYAAGI